MRSPWNIWQNLAAKGVLGINDRNANFIRLYNKRRFYPIVDDKLKTKDLAQKNSIPVPELYGVVSQYGAVKHFERLIENREDFVIKPAAGSGGQGVLVIDGMIEEFYRKPSGMPLSKEDIHYHLVNILSGMFSLGGRTDKAIIEYRVKSTPAFERVSSGGVPDVRIIVFLGVPVMAMVRLPTRMSDGKANLHQGAVGAGIDMETGVTTGAVWKNHLVQRHPDSLQPVLGVSIPHWDHLLSVAASCYEFTGLGYIGVDLVIDAEHGPMLLELNARPGLSIQIANRIGIRKRLERVIAWNKPQASKAERIAYAKENFGVMNKI